MKWLRDVLDRNDKLDLETSAARVVLAEAIIDALPNRLIATVIRESVAAVFYQRSETIGGVIQAATKAAMRHEMVQPDPAALEAAAARAQVMWADLAREIGNNAAQSVVLMLQVEPDELDAALADRLDNTDSDAPAVPQ